MVNLRNNALGMAAALALLSSGVVVAQPAQPQDNAASYLVAREGAAGTLKAEWLNNPLNGRDYELTVYRPAGIGEDVETPLLIIFDAETYLTEIPTPVILDNLIRDGLIPPVSAVFIRNPSEASRLEDLACNAEMSEAMARGLVPWVHQRIAVSSNGRDVVLAGSGFGGLMAVCANLSHPAHFGRALSQSGAFWWYPKGVKAPVDATDQYINRRVRSAAKGRGRIHLVTSNVSQGADTDDLASVVSSTEALQEALNQKDYAVDVQKSDEDSLENVWASALVKGLPELLKE
ncbi:MAG: alpha/beta hydrolase-fold protein [Asticcacaulis sp.]